MVALRTRTLPAALPRVSLRAFGTTVDMVVTDAGVLAHARDVLRRHLDAMDAMASRFRPDSELMALNAGAGTPVRVSEGLLGAVRVALRAARETGGLVDPTAGGALAVLGYDRDFAGVAHTGPALEPLQQDRAPARSLPPGAQWRSIVVNEQARTVCVPRGAVLDLGATAKALCADTAAAAIHAQTESSVIVSLGGDVATAGPAPRGGWSVGIAEFMGRRCVPGPSVSISGGGLATSGTTSRTWVRGGRILHHIIDPATGMPANSIWRTVSVLAGSCVDANVASTAAVLLGDGAIEWLGTRNLPARLVDCSGRVHYAGGWPDDSPLHAAG